MKKDMDSKVEMYYPLYCPVCGVTNRKILIPQPYRYCVYHDPNTKFINKEKPQDKLYKI